MTDKRAELEKLMRATLADEAAHHTWHYHAVRPMPVPESWRAGNIVYGDCSKGVQYLCHWVGVPDPMGAGYGPYGNSQTLCLRLQHLDHARDLEVGDIVTFGVNGDEHAAMVLEAGSDPLLWSFGHEGAPNTYLLSQDRRTQQYLRNPIPDYIPTPQDKLRAKAGWWAWVAWKLGEGDWRHYGLANKSVRPNVPKRIPLAWWRNYVVFLARRKQANKPNG